MKKNSLHTPRVLRSVLLVLLLSAAGMTNAMAQATFIVLANPSNGGTVTGGGQYNLYQTCTLRATANPGFTFVCWFKEGSNAGGVESTNAVYTFTSNYASGNVLYVAYFTPNPEYNINATANPNNGGSVSGGGTYPSGTSCTLTAVANPGYTFVNWTKNNGTQVSTNASYTFTVTGNANYVANFQTENYEITATANPAEGGAVSGEGTYTGNATCTLTATPAPGFIFDNWTKDGVVVSTNATYQFTVTESANYIANFKNIHTQTLNNGWNWWSTYIELNDNDGLSQLENNIGSAGIVIKSRADGYVEAYQYNGVTNWYGTLETLNNEQMYKIRTNAACNAAVIGMATTPSDHPINITNGWNWIGFPCNQNVNVDVAMSGFTPENNDVIKGRNGFTTYYSDDNNTMWFGTLNVLESGKGYLYQSNSSATKTLVFQTGRGEATGENVSTEHNNFQPTDEDFADNMTITAVLELDGEELRSEEYELAAFVGHECRGSVKLMYVEPINRFIAFLTVFGESSETLHFRLTDGTQTNLSTDEVTFAVDGMIGSLAEPKTLHFGNTQVGENELSKMMVYPNPSKNVFNIQGQGIRRIEVFNVFGQAIVSEETNNDYLQIDLSRYDNGCYMLRVVTDNGITNSQLIKQ